METKSNNWSERDKGREASNDYYQSTPMVGPTTGYTMGQQDVFTGHMSALESQGESSVEGDCSMKGIKQENSMEGYVVNNNPAY